MKKKPKIELRFNQIVFWLTVLENSLKFQFQFNVIKEIKILIKFY